MSQIPSHVAQAFLRPLLAMFGQPSSDEPELYLAELGRHLRTYAAPELQRAADHLVRTHKGPARWPKPAECIDACNEAREAISQSARAVKPSLLDDWNTRASNAERLMMTTELGHEAAHDGWANGLRDFIMEHRRLPFENEIYRIKDNSHFIDRAAAGTVNLGLLHNVLQRLAVKMIERRHAIADRVLNGETR